MNEYEIAGIVIVAVILFYFAAIGLLRVISFANWEKRGIHSCGYIHAAEVGQEKICPNCGNSGGWGNYTCREIIPFFTQFKDRPSP